MPHSPDVCQGPHKPKVAGSNPAPATIDIAGQRFRTECGAFLLLWVLRDPDESGPTATGP
jgi:hypothetical protein